MEHRLAVDFRIPVGRLAEGGPYPIRVLAGDTITVYKVVTEWLGPAGVIYLCWGLKDGTFPGDPNIWLAKGLFAAAAFDVPAAASYTTVTRNIQATLAIVSSMRPDTYSTYVWLSKNGSTDRAQMIELTDGAGYAPDVDDNIVQIIASEGKAKGLNVAYIKA